MAGAEGPGEEEVPQRAAVRRAPAAGKSARAAAGAAGLAPLSDAPGLEILVTSYAQVWDGAGPAGGGGAHASFQGRQGGQDAGAGTGGRRAAGGAVLGKALKPPAAAAGAAAIARAAAAAGLAAGTAQEGPSSLGVPPLCFSTLQVRAGVQASLTFTCHNQPLHNRSAATQPHALHDCNQADHHMQASRYRLRCLQTSHRLDH